MVIPGLYEVPRLLAESGLTEDDFLNNGLRADGLVFMVVVPELGACRVPDEALSHFMAGADEYAADGMPEHWSKQPSGPWTIKRERLRVLADSWEKYLILLDRIQTALEPEQSPATPEPEPKEQRQDRRLKACEAAGLVMPKSSAGRLPDGVGEVAGSAGVTRQTFSTDVKAALKRRESAKREGVKVHRA